MGKNLSKAAKRLIKYAEVAGDKNKKQPALGESDSNSTTFWVQLNIVAHILDPDLDRLPKLEEFAPIYALKSNQYRETNNIYLVMYTLVRLNRLNLLPPKWVISDLCERFEKHFANPDPDFFAGQMGVEGGGSGKSNPYREWVRDQRDQGIAREMSILKGIFTITKIDAARAVKIKLKLDLHERRIVDVFNKVTRADNFYNPSLSKKVQWSNGDIDEQVRSFPPNARKIIGKFKRMRKPGFYVRRAQILPLHWMQLH